MSWKTTLLDFCKRHGEIGKFAAKTVLGVVLPGSPVVVDLVGRALDCAVETGKDHWDMQGEPAMSEADAARLAEVLALLQGNLAALIPTLTPLQSVPDIAKQVLAAQMVADEKLAGLAVEIQQSAEQFDAFAEQQRQILEHQRFAGDALVEMLEIMRPMAGMADFFGELIASGIGGQEIAGAVAIFRAGQEAFASGNVTTARESFATFAAVHESMPVAQMALASAQAAGHEMQAAQQTIERASKLAPGNRRLTELHHRVTRLSKATPPSPGIITTSIGSPTAKPPGVGDLVDGWRLDALLGHGGMGQVFRAEKAGQWRALKIMQPAFSTDTAMAERFKREIMALAALPMHPHLVRIETFGYCPAFGCWYLVMEFVEGQSLESHLQTTGSLPVPAAVTTIAKIADGLAAAHERGILHRDIKPENIILRHGVREPVLVDFGLAGIEAAPNLTATGRAAGYTLMFASPEQLSHHPVTPASDVWSLAATLLYAVKFADAEARQARLADADDYPAELREVLTTALASRPARRFDSAAAFRDALRGQNQQSALTASPVAAQGNSQGTPQKRSWIGPVGIDLGTTHSAIAYLDEKDNPKIIANSDGERVTPSVIFIEEKQVIVGNRAKRSAAADPERVVQFVARYMGDPDWTREINGKVYTPETFSAIILRRLVKDAEKVLGGEIRDVVITVPAYFNWAERQAVVDAGRIAGLNVLGTVDGATAAALAFGIDRPTAHRQTILVCDLGGGTFDVVVARVKEDCVEVLAVHGERKLGGKDWDDELTNYAAEKFLDEFGIDPRDDLDSLQDLLIKAEETKIMLSRKDSAKMLVQCQGNSLNVKITRSEFEELTRVLLEQAETFLHIVLEEASLNWTDIDTVVCVGGMSRMPAFRDMLERTSGKAPANGVNPDEFAAQGAALYAGLLAIRDSKIRGELHSDITDAAVRRLERIRLDEGIHP